MVSDAALEKSRYGAHKETFSAAVSGVGSGAPGVGAATGTGTGTGAGAGGKPGAGGRPGAGVGFGVEEEMLTPAMLLADWDLMGCPQF